jgi:ParB family chromosome partitioning protein
MAKTKTPPAPVAGAAPNGNHRPEKYEGPRQRTVRVDQIVVLPGHNSRKDVGDVSELAESIEQNGLLQPLLVEPGSWNSAMKDYVTFHLVAGERRLTAVKKLGHKDVDVVVRDFEERRRVLAMVIENVQRENLDPLEEADAYHRAVDAGFSQKDVAHEVGKSEAHISKRLALLQLPAGAQKKVTAGDITLSDALELTKLVGHPEALKKALDKGSRGWYGGYAGAVREELNAIQAEERKARARAQLQSAGVKILKEQPGYGWYSRKEKPLLGQGADYEAIGLTVEQHKDQPCHAAAIDGEGRVIHVCTEPERHVDEDARAKAATQEQARRSEGRQKELRKNKQLKLETEARAKTAAHVLEVGDLSAQLTFIAVQLADTARTDEGRVACELLSLDADKQRFGYPDYSTALVKHAQTSKKAAWQVLTALAMAQSEGRLRNRWSGQSEKDKAYLEMLTAAGYVKPKLPAVTKPKASAKKGAKTKPSAATEKFVGGQIEKLREDAERKRLRQQRLQADREAFPEEHQQPSVDEAITTAIARHTSPGDAGGPGALHVKYQPKCRKCGRTEADGVVMVELLGDGQDLCDACDR